MFFCTAAVHDSGVTSGLLQFGACRFFATACKETSAFVFKAHDHLAQLTQATCAPGVAILASL
jgi:hypothetical protein